MFQVQWQYWFTKHMPQILTKAKNCSGVGSITLVENYKDHKFSPIQFDSLYWTINLSQQAGFLIQVASASLLFESNIKQMILSRLTKIILLVKI